MTDLYTRCACGHLLYLHGTHGCISMLPSTARDRVRCPCARTRTEPARDDQRAEVLYYD